MSNRSGLTPPLRDSIEDARGEFQDAVLSIEEIPEVRVQGNDLLEAVFRNLLHNAVVHNDKQTPTVQISTTVVDETLRIRVADNGPGIPDDQKEMIFGKGETGLESPGTGIGLYLVQTLVEQYGGAVWVEDSEPEGAEFVVELPIAE
jgi:signal transduction histidine kinase